MKIEPYLSFEGRCEEALAFYQKTLGATVEMMMRVKDAPPQPQSADGCGPGAMPADKILHSSLLIGESRVMATDGMCSGTAKFEGISLSITAKDEAEAKRAFDGLAAGGAVTMPLGATFFSPCFGMTKDRFGLHWMIMVPMPQQ